VLTERESDPNSWLSLQVLIEDASSCISRLLNVTYTITNSQ